VEARIGKPRRVGGMTARRLERGAPLDLLRVVRERALDLAQRVQPCAVERRERRVRVRLGLREPGPGDGAIREAPSEQRAEAPARRVAAVEIAGRKRDGAGRSREAYARV